MLLDVLIFFLIKIDGPNETPLNQRTYFVMIRFFLVWTYIKSSIVDSYFSTSKSMNSERLKKRVKWHWQVSTYRYLRLVIFYILKDRLCVMWTKLLLLVYCIRQKFWTKIMQFFVRFTYRRVCTVIKIINFTCTNIWMPWTT